MISRKLRGRIWKAALVYGAAFFLLTSCKSANLKPDNAAMSAIDANYPTVEFSIGDNLYHGYALHAIKPGGNVTVKVQGYYQGAVRIDGQCLPDKVDKLYNTNEVISLTLSPKNSCFVRIIMYPDYKDNKEPITVFPILGYVAIKVADIDNYDYVFDARRYKEGLSQKVSFQVGGEGTSHLVFDGCGKKVEMDLPIKNENVEVDLRDVISNKATCVLEGYATSPIFAPLRFSILSVMYKKDYVELSKLRAVIRDDGKLLLQGEASVSVISYDDQYYFSNDVTIQKFDKNQPHIIRGITVKGRTVLGVWDPKTKGVSWKR